MVDPWLAATAVPSPDRWLPLAQLIADRPDTLPPSVSILEASVRVLGLARAHLETISSCSSTLAISEYIFWR